MAEKKEDKATLNEQLLKSRTIIISEAISEELAQRIFTQIVLLNQDSTTKEIFVYVNSPGGSADSGFAIYDMLKFFPAPVVTICSGLCASAAVIVFLAANANKNYSLPNSRFLLHQPSTGVRGQASDIDITAEEISKIRIKYNEIIAEITNKTLDEVSQDADRDFWMSPKEAKEYGLISDIIVDYKQLKVK